MKTIWKFPIPVDDEFTIDMPVGREILHVDVQRGQPCIWARVDPEMGVYPYEFSLRGTGHDLTDVGPHIGSFQLDGGEFVFHLFHRGQ